MHNFNTQSLNKKIALVDKFLIVLIVAVVAFPFAISPAKATYNSLQKWVQKVPAFKQKEKTALTMVITPTVAPTVTPTPSPTAVPTATPTIAPTAIPQPTLPPANNVAPNSGYSSQYVQTSQGSFLVAIIAGDLASTRVVIDTASDSTCKNDCPVLSVGTYAQRSGAYAAINGSFFCPPEYPSCAGKTNSFDTLLMNKNKTYFNSENNVYSTVPLIYFSGTTAGVRGQSLEWGRDTGVDAVIANHPLYVAGGNNVYGGSSDPKITSRGTRTFLGNKGSTAYMGIVYNASAADAAAVLAALKLDNALGLDQGGSTALWYNGSYLAGPGRSVPNAVLFLRK